MDIRFAIRALEVPTDEPQWQTAMLKQLGRPDHLIGKRDPYQEKEQPPKHPKPLSPAICR
jgi:hypothetical protein